MLLSIIRISPIIFFLKKGLPLCLFNIEKTSLLLIFEPVTVEKITPIKINNINLIMSH